MLTMNETPAFFKTSAKLLAGFDCIRRLRGIMTSLMLGMAKSQIDKPSSRKQMVSERHHKSTSKFSAKLAAKSMKLHTTGEVTPSTQGVVKTRSLKSRLKISRTSDLTVFSKASWLPNQMLTQRFTTLRSHSKTSPAGPWCFRSQHVLRVRSKDMSNSCCFITSNSRKYFRTVLTVQ